MKGSIGKVFIWLSVAVVSLTAVACSDSNNQSDVVVPESVNAPPEGGEQQPVIPTQLEPPTVVDPPIASTAIDPVIRTEDEVFAFRENSQFAGALKTCNAQPYQQSQTDCTLALLPYIALDNPGFTREDIMDRVLVSHRWMGRRFEQLLNDAPDTLITLFGSATGVIISSDIRPSNYKIWTGAIRIDPRYLWITVPEKRTILIQDDFREDYSRDLQFSFFRSLLKNNDWAIPFASLESDDERSFADMRLAFQSLMFHELAHANDYAPASVIPQIDRSLTILNAGLQMYESAGGSKALYDALPLQSVELIELGGVSFLGNIATEAQKQVQADYVGSLMAGDGATHYYSYSTIFEDFATLVEMAMMYYHHQVTLNIAYTNKPQTENFSCDDLKVGWGVRDRLADPTTNARAQIALDRLFGPSLAGNFLANYAGREELMTVGLSYCDNQVSPLIALNRDVSFLAQIPYQRHHIDVDFGGAVEPR